MNLQKQVEKAYDLIHGSPVKSSPEVRSIETNILKTIDELSDEVANKEFENIEGTSNHICHLAEERNRKLINSITNAAQKWANQQRICIYDYKQPNVT